MAEIVIIAAVAEADRLIGDGLDLPWRISEDLKRFKRLTLGHPLVMGRRTFESLVYQFGGPLAGRDNAVLTHEPDDVDEAGRDDVHVFTGMEAALHAFSDRERVFIGGGASVYEAALPLADRLELTLVEGAFSGDTYFPPYEHLIGSVFEPVSSERYPAVGSTPAFRFETYVRRAA
ncbi:MAG: dihydrofolate reductase [Rhodothermaceae bacterium]|nr:dihydrofolate reductase [Rhodothermaceae bacterium]